MLCKIHVILGRSVVISDFRHLNLASILENNSLQYFILIKEQVYPNAVILVYSNLSFKDNVIHFRVGKYEINMPMKVFARISTSLLRVLTYMTMILESFENYPEMSLLS